MIKRQIQQGDVIIKEVDALPKGVESVPRRNGKVVVMEGEATGHSHVIDSDKAALWVLNKSGISQIYLEVAEPVTIYHDEHKPLPIPAGIYEIGRVLEYNHFEMAYRVVSD
jgi:hypothetical protein